MFDDKDKPKGAEAPPVQPFPTKAAQPGQPQQQPVPVTIVPPTGAPAPHPVDPKTGQPVKPDETKKGGLYIRGGKAQPDGTHKGGEVVNAEGEVLGEFGDDEVNPGKDFEPKPKRTGGDLSQPPKK